MKVNLPDWRAEQTPLHQPVEVQAGHDEGNLVPTLNTHTRTLCVISCRHKPALTFCSFTLQMPMIKPGHKWIILMSRSLPM